MAMSAAAAAAAARSRSSSSEMVATTSELSHTIRIRGYAALKGLPTGAFFSSAPFAAGGQTWALDWFPNGVTPQAAAYMSFYLRLQRGTPPMANFQLHLLDRQEVPVRSRSKETGFHPYRSLGARFGFSEFVTRSYLERSRHLEDDGFSVRCDLSIVTEVRRGDPAIVAPPSYLAIDLGNLLQSGEGADVTFVVDGERISAHRLLLAARSAVFKVELFGQMTESDPVNVVVVDEIRPDIFRDMLFFIYTDTLPRIHPEEEAALAQHLLVAADRYGLESLSVVCESVLCRRMDVSNAAYTLALAEQHFRPCLKEYCFKFMVAPGKANLVMKTDGYKHLELKCPNVISELTIRLADST